MYQKAIVNTAKGKNRYKEMEIIPQKKYRHILYSTFS